MIRRTLLEWTGLQFGEGDDKINRGVADRLHAAASASRLGHVALDRRANGLYARHVVGVVVAGNCVLEILPKIDFAGDSAPNETRIRDRLVHMLAFAFDFPIAAGAATGLGTQRDNLLEILIALFASRLTDAVRKGMPRRYVEVAEDLPTLRGRLDLRRQFTVLAASPQRLACRFDDLSPDIALNQIMKAAITRLLRITRSASNDRALRELAAVYADITPVHPRRLAWNEVSLDRTNVRWKGLLNLAKMLLGDRFQTTSSGQTEGISLLFDMNILFETYTARLVDRVLQGTGFKATAQGGFRKCLRDESGSELFLTKPDILIRRGEIVEAIIDTKWKPLSDKIDDPKRGVSQSDIYQIMAYSRLYRCRNVVLLYPHHVRLKSQPPLLAMHTIAPFDNCNRLTIATVEIESDSSAIESLRKNLENLFNQDVEGLRFCRIASS
ncbi:restriction endonuclease [Fulvimarina endophytica]|uniref:Restriction endonuclease n=1 Tax=Fulvimarina endophytica TaxID=2293836 RepID=A0A371WZB1_9HYPH|nr:restriction endonuclease [Fulvimarina endophytica]RFC62266.1 restriction endonuclease [Fulvimarina endophytica]